MLAPDSRRTLVRVVIGLLAGIALGAVATLALRGSKPSGPLSHDEPVATAKATSSTEGEARWLKGQLHAHSGNSGDSQTPPADVLRWYSEHGFDFVVFTDHNHVTALPSNGTTLAIPGVELTLNQEECSPAPEKGMSCLFHVNALFASAEGELPSWPPSPVPSGRQEAYGAALEASKKLGALAQLNHPNFHYALDAETIARLASNGAALLEVANEALDSNNAGDKAHPSTEALWDLALSQGARIWATATDDAHHYFDADAVRAKGEVAFEGNRGFVMVRAQKDPESIRSALERGQFYASSGVVLSQLEEKNGVLRVAVDPSSEGEHYFAFIGRNGDLLGDRRGREAGFALDQVEGGGYVRAVVTAPNGKKAWTQPVFLP